MVLVSDVEPLVYRYIVLLHLQFLDEELRIEVFQERVRVFLDMILIIIFASLFVEFIMHFMRNLVI